MVRSGAESGALPRLGRGRDGGGTIPSPRRADASSTATRRSSPTAPGSEEAWTPSRRRRFAYEVAGVGVALVLVIWELLGRVVLDHPLAWWVAPTAGVLLGIVARLRQPPAEYLASHSRTRLYAIGAAMVAPPILLSVEHFLMSRSDAGTATAVASAACVVYPLVMAWVHGGLRQMEAQTTALGELASVDHLTGLLNRRSADDALRDLIGRGRRAGGPVSVAMLDLDHFKQFNDTHGHAAGDELLVGAATAWSARLARSDVLTRYGGEEFLLISRRGIADTLALTNRMRPDTPAEQTFSAGVAEWDGRESAEHLIARADTSLYEAKENGRRRSVAASAPHPPSGARRVVTAARGRG